MNHENELKFTEACGMAPVKLEYQTESNICCAANNVAGQMLGTCDTKSASIYEGTSYQAVDLLNQRVKVNRTEAMAVDVIGSRKGPPDAAGEDPDATECSSSFADTTSGDESCLGLSDAEVESQFYGSYDGLGSLFPVRKKKLTNHWRNFIQPLMWRCKWTELKIKEFESQASKYNRKIADYDENKLMAYDESIVQQCGSNSLPYTFQKNRKKPLKRRKRKSVEQTTDIASYMENHHLFSCRENKKFDLCLSSTGVDLLNPGQNSIGTDDFSLNEDLPIQEENTTSNCEEQILGKIDLMYSRVHKLKSQLDSIMCKYAGKFSSCESLSHLVAYDGQTSSAHSPTFSACNDPVQGGLYSSIDHMPDYDCGDFVLPDTAISSFGEAALIPDIIESTVGRLSSADVTQHHAQTGGDSCEKIVDNIVIKHEAAAEMETHVVKQTVNETGEKQQDNSDTEIGEGQGTSTPSHLSSDPDKMPQGQLNLPSALTSDIIQLPKLKRKRGERKAGAGGWCRQQTAEPDAH